MKEEFKIFKKQEELLKSYQSNQQLTNCLIRANLILLLMIKILSNHHNKIQLYEITRIKNRWVRVNYQLLVLNLGRI